tara:strand:+ start:5630 stop:5860 length:231 start_codon:yes stop_codon:yes gene_type:complete
MNATDIVNIIGNARKTADLCGVSITQVYRMTYPKGYNNGSGNRIDPKHFKKILKYSNQNNLGITKDDLWSMLPEGE